MRTPARTTRTLLLAVDFSRPASRAVPYAIKLAWVLNLGLTILHVVQAPPDFDSWAPATRRSLNQPKTKALLELGRLVRLASESHVAAEHRLLVGVPEDAILQVADSARAALIVMGTHGRSGLDRFKVGSVADAVLRRTPCPVLTIRTSAGGHPAVHPLRLKLGRIAVATDFSPSSETALRRAVELARLLNAQVVLLHVAETRSSSLSESVRASNSAHKRTEEKFRQAISACRGGDVVSEHLVLHGDPAETILAQASRTRANLIVVGTEGRRGVQRLLLGSVAESVIRGANCPVLVVRNDRRNRRLALLAPAPHRH